MKLTNLADVEAYLASIPATASEARKWQVVRTATKGILKSHGVGDYSMWRIEPLPPQAHTRYGDCHWMMRRIRYRKAHVREWWTVTLADTIIHECAHAITASEMRKQGKHGTGGHGPMWRGTAAALGLRFAQAKNLTTAGEARKVES